MKKLIFISLALLISCKSQTDNKLTELEQEKLKRITLELQPLLNEKQAIAITVCGRNGFDLESCRIDIATGLITSVKSTIDLKGKK